jgi:hypothetical protein
LVYVGYVCAPLWRSADTDGAASGFRFVSGDMAVPGGAVGDGLALVGQSVLAVRGPVGVLLFAALAGGTGAVAWLVDGSVCDGGAR